MENADKKQSKDCLISSGLMFVGAISFLIANRFNVNPWYVVGGCFYFIVAGWHLYYFCKSKSDNGKKENNG